MKWTSFGEYRRKRSVLEDLLPFFRMDLSCFSGKELISRDTHPGFLMLRTIARNALTDLHVLIVFLFGLLLSPACKKEHLSPKLLPSFGLCLTHSGKWQQSHDGLVQISFMYFFGTVADASYQMVWICAGFCHFKGLVHLNCFFQVIDSQGKGNEFCHVRLRLYLP